MKKVEIYKNLAIMSKLKVFLNFEISPTESESHTENLCWWLEKTVLVVVELSRVASAKDGRFLDEVLSIPRATLDSQVSDEPGNY
jgi:hypothetical protein